MKHIFIVLSAFLLFSCSSDSGGEPKQVEPSGFNRTAMLTHWANDIIIPAYADLTQVNSKLQDDIQQFVDTPNQTNLENARASFRMAYITWQKAAFFEVGPAKNENLRQYFNIYPTHTTNIKNAVAKSDYQLHLTSNASIQGYPALDYLLNGIGADDNQIIQIYTTNTQAQDYKRFLLSITNRLKEKTETVYKAWDTYKTTFIQNDGSSATSSVDLIANDYLLFYEKYYRNGKIRIPAGYSTGKALPNHVEAYYSPDLSLELFKTATKAMHQFFQGQNYNHNQKSLGFQQYLEALKKQDIAADINQQFQVIEETSNALNGTLQEVVTNDRESVLNLQDKIQKNVIPLKVDMLQALNISVAYFDGDGD